MKIAVDFDDTIANSLPAFLRAWYVAHPKPFPYRLGIEDINHWGLALILQAPEDEITRVFEKVKIPRISAMDGALETLRRLQRDGHEIVVATANGRVREIYSWLVERGLTLDVVYSPNKPEWCFENGVNLLIDDKDEDVSKFISVYRGQGILFTRPWNKESSLSAYHSARNWEEVYARIRTFHYDVVGLATEDEEILVNENGAKQSNLGARYDLLPAQALEEVAKVLHRGAEKYGEDNWRGLSVKEIHNHTLGHAVQFNQSDALEDLAHTACRALMALEIFIEQKN